MLINSKRELVIDIIIIIVVIVIGFLAFKNSFAGNEEWKNLGPAGFSDGTVYEASIAIHECDDVIEQPNQNPATSEVNTSESLNQSASFSYSGGGTNDNDGKCVEVYTGFKDVTNSGGITVMKYNSYKEDWDLVGDAGFSNGNVVHTDLAINSKGVPYVAFVFSDIYLKVMKFNGTKWEYVGSNTGILSGQAADTSLQFDANDVPYVSFSYKYPAGSNTAVVEARVLKYNGTNWEHVGGNNNISKDHVKETALFFDSNNIPYIAYTNSPNRLLEGITVKKYNDSTKSWEMIGADNFSSTSEYISLKLGPDNVPYVSFLEKVSLEVMKFNGTKWEYIGNSVISSYITHPPSLIIGTNNVPYIFYQDPTNKSKATVKGYNDQTKSWDDFGRPGFSPAGVRIYDNKSIAVDSDGNLYVAFKDYGNKDKVTVMTTADNLKSYNKASWQNVGSAGFTSGVANFISLNIDSQNNKYVAFQDYANGAKASVMKFNGTSWGYLGTAGFSSGVASQVSSTIDLNDNLYVAYQDGNISGKATIKKWDGMNWVNLGMPGFSTSNVSNTNIKVDTMGNPYVSYLESSKTIVKKYNNVTNFWDDVATSSLPQSREVTFAIDSNNVPHVALRDVLNGDKLTVMAYNDLLKKWELVGPTAGFSAGTVGNLSLAFSSNNIPEVAFSDGAQAGKVTVMYFDGSSWVNSGNPGFSSGRAGFITMDIDTRDRWNNILYVSFVDYDNGKKISTMKYDPIKGWVVVGNPIGSGLYSSLKLDQNGVPFNAFQDMVNGNKASLMKFE